MTLHKITQVFAAIQLVLLEPFVQYGLLVLQLDRLRKLHGFKVEQDTKILQDRAERSRGDWYMLELFD